MNMNSNYSMVGLPIPHVSHYDLNHNMNHNMHGMHGMHRKKIHQIFEINVINNLARASIFVQIKSEINTSQSIDMNANMQIPAINTQPIQLTDTEEYKNISKEEPAVPVVMEEPNLKPTTESGAKYVNVHPGFVRIASFQSLPIPVYVSSNNNTAFITVYVEDIVSNKVICLANQLQINRQNIEIKRSENGNHIVLKAIFYKQNQIDNLLYSWGIPQYLCNSMKNSGWEDINLWSQITETDLIEMGFQRGHRLIFFDKLEEVIGAKGQALITNKNKFDAKGQALIALYIKYILQSWHLPIYLYSNMVENGWIDPRDWTEITEIHFKKMGFKDGHIVKFQKEIKNNHHLIVFKEIMAQHEKKQQSSDPPINTPPEELIVPLLNPLNSLKTQLQPTFKVYPTTITHEQCEYKLDTTNGNKFEDEKYYLEIKTGNNPWQQKEEITDTKRRTICELDMNTTYFIRIRSENKTTNKITYSQIAEVKTKDEKWKNINLPKIPDFKYAVSSNNKQITVEFDPKSLEQIKQTKFDERYSLDIGLSKDDGLDRIVNWKNVATLRKDKLIYKYNVNDQKDADWVHVGISARNDLGQRYNQCTRTRQFPFNQVIKRINTTKHGNNLQFDESMTVATKIDQDYQYSTFAFGQPITNEMCNRYDMYVKVNKLETDCFMGFAPSLESVIDWNQALGYGGNRNSSVGVLASKSSADFAVYNKDQDKRHIFPTKSLNNEQKWDDGSIFVLSFDFLNDDCNIYLNEDSSNGLDRNRLLKSIKLNQLKSVVPSFSLNSQGDSVQVVKWRLY